MIRTKSVSMKVTPSPVSFLVAADAAQRRIESQLPKPQLHPPVCRFP